MSENIGRYELALGRVKVQRRILAIMVSDMENDVSKNPVDPETLNDMAEKIHTLSIDLLERCEELSCAIDPTWLWRNQGAKE